MGRVVPWFILAAFSIALGEMAWVTFGPPSTPDYFISGEAPAIVCPDPNVRQIYLRHMVYLPQHPLHCWLEIAARDNVVVYVNGTFLDSHILSNFGTGLIVDPNPLLHPGTNVIAVACHQTSVGRPPAVAIRGSYELTDGEHSLGLDTPWRCSWTIERRAGWWFDPKFDDRQWAPARTQTCDMRSRVKGPPRAVSTRDAGQWITSAAPARERMIAMRREFTLQTRPASAWLRLTANADYRLAINGAVVEREESTMGTPLPTVPVQRTYDLTQFLHTGDNTLTLLMTGTMETPSLLADLEVEDSAGHREWFGTDKHWEVQSGCPSDWCRVKRDEGSQWRPCSVESGFLDVLPWKPARRYMKLSLPLWLTLWRDAGQVSVIALVGLLTWWLARGLERRLAPGRAGAARPRVVPVVYLSLVPTTLAIGAAILATYDPDVARQDIYQARWVVLAVLAVLAQWAWLLRANLVESIESRLAVCPKRRAVALATFAVVVVAVGVAFGLRATRINADALQTDEIWQIMALKGVWTSGFPYFQADDLPRNYITTSELLYYVLGAASVFWKASFAINRVPSVLFGTLNVLLLYQVGRRMFCRDVGLLAAALGALSPVCIDASTWGRYPSLLQLLTLLTVYLYWRTIEGEGPIRPRLLWLTTGSFIGMYLTWEGSGLVALGMILATLLLQRGRLRRILCDVSVWLALLAVLIVIGLQYSHRTFQLTTRLWYGTGITDIVLTPMWLYPGFQPLYYLWETAWNRDAFLPAMTFVAAIFVTVRHAFDRAARYLIIIIATTCGAMSLLVPLQADRYVFHIVPLTILLCSAGAVAIVRALMKLVRRPGESRPQRFYACGVTCLSLIMFVVLANGWCVQTVLLKPFTTENYGPNDLRFPNMGGCCQFLRERIRPGDILMTDRPHMIDHLMTSDDGGIDSFDHYSDYYLQTTLFIQVALANNQDQPLNFYRGIPVLTNKKFLDDVVARHRRIWYVIWPGVCQAGNTRDVTQFVREQMQVEYEDFWAMVLLIDDQHRTAEQQHLDERSLIHANAIFLR